MNQDKSLSRLAIESSWELAQDSSRLRARTRELLLKSWKQFDTELHFSVCVLEENYRHSGEVLKVNVPSPRVP